MSIRDEYMDVYTLADVEEHMSYAEACWKHSDANEPLDYMRVGLVTLTVEVYRLRALLEAKQ